MKDDFDLKKKWVRTNRDTIEYVSKLLNDGVVEKLRKGIDAPTPEFFIGLHLTYWTQHFIGSHYNARSICYNFVQERDIIRLLRKRQEDNHTFYGEYPEPFFGSLFLELDCGVILGKVTTLLKTMGEQISEVRSRTRSEELKDKCAYIGWLCDYTKEEIDRLR